jgi:hypothetical protein
MDKVLVVGLLIVASVITATILFVVFRTSIEESRGSAVGLQEQASERAQTGLALVEVIPGNDGSKVDLWVKNIGVIDIQPIRNIDLFLVDIDGDRGGYLRYSEIGPAFMEDTWSVVGPFNVRLRPGETIQLHADLFRNPLTTGEYLFTVSTPSDVSASTLFSADPNAPSPPQPPPPPPPLLPFTLVTNVLPPGAGIVVGAGVYSAGITVPVTATRNPGFRFDNWSGDCVGTGLCNVFMDADKAVTANFSRSEFTLITNALPAVGGAVAGSGTYPIGTVVNVTQVANAGFTFDNWSGDCVGTAQCNVTMDSDKSVTANYSGRLFTLTATPAPIAGGTVTGGGTYVMGRVVTVTQVANAGFTFDNWSGDCSGTGSCTVTMDQDKDVEANYSAAVPPPQPPAGCNPTPAGAAPVLNSIDMSSGYPRQMLAVNGDTTGASVIWGAGSGTETTITTGVGGTQYFQVPENATPGSYPVAIRVGANTSNIVCVTVLAVSGVFPAPRIEDIGLNGRTGSDIALTVSAANMDANATLSVNGVTISNSDLWGVISVPYLLLHVPSTYGYPIYHYSQLKGIVSNATPGSVLNVTVTNTDGQASSKSYNLPPSWAALDSDGDGLLDTWEDSGYTRPGGGTVNLPAMGASKYRKDILIESDWVAVAAPSVNVFTTSINTFAQAPVLNTDGSKGIDLIIDRGQGGPFTEGGEILAPHNTIWFGGISNGSYKNFYDYKPTNFNSDRLGLFHYNVFGRRSPTGSSGVAEGPGGGPDRGDDFLVSCDWCNEGGLIGTFLHELGHNLNLHHGGLMWPPEPQNWHGNPYRPNNPSIMSYRYQIFGTNTSCTKSNDGLYTYSQGQMRTINELNTDERIGICDNIALDLSEPFPDGIISTGRINSDDPHNRNSNFRTADDTHVDQDQWGQIILDFQNN